VHRDVIGLVALDLILWLVWARMVRIALIVGVSRVDLDDPATDVPCLGIPGDMVANFETIAHFFSPDGEVPDAAAPVFLEVSRRAE
jgi:hypothetical protein